MSLTQRFRVVLGVQIALGVGIAILLVSLIRNQHELRRSQDVHHQASLLADELRQSSDDLTRMARTYVVTGDARFERDYWAILDIRNGKRARPVDYHRVYWDLVLPGKPAPRPTDRIISMQDLMATLGLTATERALLTRAQGNSDALARIEDIAFHAVKGQFADTTGGFTIHGDPDRPLATRLLNDSAYFEQKAAIMAPIDSFYVLLERRTAERVAMDERRSLRLLQSLGALLFTILGAFLYSFLTLQRQIAAREHSEQALRVSEERWKFALEGSGDGVWDWNLETGTAVFSPAWKRMLGFADHEIADRAEEWTTRVHPDDLPGVMATIQAHLDGTTAAAVVENRMRAADGTWRWVLGRGMVVARNPDGKPLRMVGTNTDITERKEAERTLQLMRTSLDSASDALFWMSPDGRIVQVNDAACRLLGYTRGELLALRVPDVDAHYNADLWRTHFPALRAAGSLTFETEQRAKNGRLIPVEIVANYVRIDDEEFNCAFVRDITARKRSDAALQASEALIEQAFGAAPIGMGLVSLEGRYLKVNPALCAMLGWSDAELLALDFQSVTHPDDVATSEGLSREMIDGLCTSYEIEKRYRRKDGSELLAQLNVSLVRDAVGVPVHFVAQVQDITGRKLAEERQRAADARFRSWFDLPIVGICITSPTKGWLEINDHLCEMLGYERRELQGMTWADLTHPEDLTADSIQFERVLRGEIEGYSLEKRFLRKDGRTLPSELSVRCVRNPDGTVNYFVALIADITERRRVEAAHRLESAALQAVANAVMITDRAGVIVWTNGAFTTITGFTTDEALGRTPGDLLRSGEHNLAFYQALWGTILAGDVWRGEMINRRKDGSRYTEEMTITPLMDPSGTISHFIAIKQDITHRRTLEAQLQQAQKMESVGLLAGGVAHDFNNMLGVILGTVDLAMEEVDATQPIHEELLEIRMAAVRSADLTRQLLAFARQQTIAPTVLDLNETVPGMLSMLQRLIGEDISLHWQPAASLWPVLMDRSQMDQILTNLCVNARHAIAGIGTLSIATANTHTDAAFCEAHAEAVPGDYVMLRVRDTGIGMDAATQARIFEPFFSTKGVGEGTGLGLATVYGAVKQNQGFVTVSSALGEGTTFEIYLPRHKGAVTPARLSGPAAARLRGGETILLVEDEPALIRLVTKALEAQGYVVLAANSAANTLRLATEHADTIHLLVSDVVMPGMNGRDLAARVQALRPTIKSLFMSGHTADVIAIRGLLSPDVEFIEKPFTPVALAAKVREVLDA